VIILRSSRTVLNNASPFLEMESGVVLSGRKALIGSPLRNGIALRRIHNSPNSFDQTATVVALPVRISLFHRIFVILNGAPKVFCTPGAILEAETQ
jgi:hypothetical protein